MTDMGKMLGISFGLIVGSDEETIEDDEEPEPEPMSVKRKDAERIIMERYAKGDITSEQYTEMRSRL